MNRSRLSLFPLLLVFAACATGLSGRYDVQTVDGETLPVDFIFGTELTALDLQLNEDGTCWISVHTTGGDTPVIDDDCTWTTEGTTITFGDDGDTLTGTAANGTLTVTDSEGTVLVFVRRSSARD